MWPANSISLCLQSETIVLHGTSESAPGQILRGSATLDIQYQTKISSITVVFKGTAYASTSMLMLSVGSKQSRDVFYQREIEFLRTIEVAKNFSPGQYIYHFEIPFSGDLPESISSSLSHIKYVTTAVAKRGGFAKNLKDSKVVNVLRLSQPVSEVEESQSLVRFGELESELAFCIFSPSIVYSPDNDIPIQIGVDSFKTDVKVSEVQAAIYEVIKATSQDGRFKVRRSKIREASCRWNTKSYGKMWIQPITLTANKKSTEVFSDRENDYVTVHHELNVIITLVKRSNIRKRIIVRTSLQFVDSEALRIAKALPCYEQSLVAPPCYFHLDKKH
ncbi:hypothetical protein K493DRAFT_305670 [Basidiobolus meristosporus CBS 931.73]|uniref:Arrestin-like N-terminal domain-containing protein n=1 Tax=Basidiobolus meristosporus CBS 931.73 TaxID=1314790 RepID=A0A1Y1XUX9_9FUNG|nr:hypothetical protein K493DRAFT_305670 [Basidiobolus meristosporus CBS 931.73]|eukprot:ORX89559.1 hypothetical protein K493DRAFT_305670 [Basidiobolus meristosporus CBS 931.73]